MQLVVQSYEAVELLQVRSELEKRGIAVHLADEFTYAIPGMPGAEQPRGIWVADEDLYAAQLVVRDLLGPDRVHQPEPTTDQGATARAGSSNAVLDKWIWIIAAIVALAAVLSLIEQR